MSPSDEPRAPRFTEAFPDDPELERLVRAFMRGDYGRVRRDAPKLIDRTALPKVRAAALEILRRTGPDPRIAVLFALTAALLVFLSSYWWWKAGGG